VFVEAGSGGVGTIALQLAKHLGASVATTASAANRELVEHLGADVVVDYRHDDVTAVLDGYDVALYVRADGAQLTQIAALVDDGAIRPVIDRTFPFAATGDALAAVESGRSRGKVVVTMR
jgi:NADPH:quinone reductase-like Zn-dependent oxidoreductase